MNLSLSLLAAEKHVDSMHYIFVTHLTFHIYFKSNKEQFSELLISKHAIKDNKAIK